MDILFFAMLGEPVSIFTKHKLLANCHFTNWYSFYTDQSVRHDVRCLTAEVGKMFNKEGGSRG